MKRILTALLCLLALTACGGVPPEEAHESIQVIAMDTPMLLTAYGESATKAVYAAEDVIRDLDARLSRTDPDSEVSRLNAAAGREMQVKGDLARLLMAANWYWECTGGAFDITVAPVVSAWGFGGEAFRVPSQEELDALLERVDGAGVAVMPPYVDGDGETKAVVRLAPGQSIDLGAIAKGWAANRIAEVLRENGVERATAQLGGNVLAWGSRPDGAPWRVGVQDPARPDDPEGFVGVLELEDAFAVTSGGYQRYFEQDGKRYHHIIDPATGYPADSGLNSVTVVAGLGEGDGSGFPGTMCDAYSTALFIMGEEKALDFWRDETRWGEHGCPFEFVLVTEDGRVVVTEGLADRFTLDESSGYSYEIVS